MTKLQPRHVEYIANYSGLRQQFVNLFWASLQTENPRFLLAVVDYKKNPKWDSCISIYHLFIRDAGGGRLEARGRKPADGNIVVTTQTRVNLPESTRLDLEAKMKTRKGQVGGMGDPRIFDAAFMVVVRATNGQYHLRAMVSTFLEDHVIDAASSGKFSHFQAAHDATLPL